MVAHAVSAADDLTGEPKLVVDLTDEAEWSKLQPVPTERRNFPALAAHLSERMAGTVATVGGSPNGLREGDRVLVAAAS